MVVAALAVFGDRENLVMGHEAACRGMWMSEQDSVRCNSRIMVPGKSMFLND